jgi:hypothetical protein
MTSWHFDYTHGSGPFFQKVARMGLHGNKLLGENNTREIFKQFDPHEVNNYVLNNNLLPYIKMQ